MMADGYHHTVKIGATGNIIISGMRDFQYR